MQEPRPSSSSGPEHESEVSQDTSAQTSQQAHTQSSPAASAELVLADQVGSSSEPRPQQEEQQAATMPEAVQPPGEVQERAVQELQRQRSLEISAHLAQVRREGPSNPCKIVKVGSVLLRPLYALQP